MIQLCAACGRNEKWQRDLCQPCLNSMNNVTRSLYLSKRTDTRRAVEALHLQRTSVKVIHGGRHTK